MQVKEVMSHSVVTVDAEETAAAAARLLSRNNIGVLPVCSKEGKLKGILTDRDIVLRCVAANLDPNTAKVQNIMTGKVVCVAPEDMAQTAADIMAKEQIRRLPVTEHGKVIGMVSLGDLARTPDYSTEAAECLSEICHNIHER